MTDFTLLMQSVSDDIDGALDSLMDLYADEMLNYFYKHCWSLELSEDLCQELFVKLYTRRHQFKFRQSIGKGYMYSIAYNLWVDFCRRKATRREIDIDEYQIDSYQVDPAENLLFDEAQKDVAQSLDSLSSKHREVVLLIAFQNLTYKEVSDALNIAVGTVKSRLHHGLKKMQELLREKHAPD